MLRYPLDGFLDGARSALRAAGRERTPAAIWEAVEAMQHLDWWELMIADVIGRTNPDVSTDELEAAWVQAGREAVGRAAAGEDLSRGTEDGHGNEK